MRPPGLLAALLLAAAPVWAADPPALDEIAVVEPATLVPATRSGREIYARFREGLADPVCEPESSSPRWRRHFSAATRRLGGGDEQAMALFGYVVDALREASLPTEYALIPFVESGYKPDARSKLGPAGMWQFIRLTARAHQVPMHAGYDGRLSPVDSTRAAVRYLKTLHGMFAGDWRLAVMAYNAGEYRVFGALRRSGQVARDADPEKLESLSGITRAYVRKLHALSCLLDRADDDPAWLASLDRQVPLLEAVELPAGTRDIAAWASGNGRDPARVRRLNPAFAGGRVPHGEPRRVLAQALRPAPPLAATAGAGPDAAAQGTLSP
ncbi:lytic transglycosylase domain-containing protein [Cognatiluteimonas lumbrici]|uniref:lytic transglycosylase domain-containing protein n=1 Tax=Cognatiluteimonas lumbrici TaxID=2559601 RepID=UPI001FE2E120|nr:lytic transglycosylase domain-containing protein [Luteimonas lumbrici]